MMSQTVDFKKSIYELVKENPDVSTIMHDLGFTDIVKPGMLNTAGRIMTIPTGATMKKIDLGKIKQTFQEKGYQIID